MDILWNGIRMMWIKLMINKCKGSRIESEKLSQINSKRASRIESEMVTSAKLLIPMMVLASDNWRVNGQALDAEAE